MDILEFWFPNDKYQSFWFDRSKDVSHFKPLLEDADGSVITYATKLKELGYDVKKYPNEIYKKIYIEIRKKLIIAWRKTFGSVNNDFDEIFTNDQMVTNIFNLITENMHKLNVVEYVTENICSMYNLEYTVHY